MPRRATGSNRRIQIPRLTDIIGISEIRKSAAKRRNSAMARLRCGWHALWLVSPLGLGYRAATFHRFEGTRERKAAQDEHHET